jgi:hypothetical protein
MNYNRVSANLAAYVEQHVTCRTPSKVEPSHLLIGTWMCCHACKFRRVPLSQYLDTHLTAKVWSSPTAEPRLTACKFSTAASIRRPHIMRLLCCIAAALHPGYYGLLPGASQSDSGRQMSTVLMLQACTRRISPHVSWLAEAVHGHQRPPRLRHQAAAALRMNRCCTSVSSGSRGSQGIASLA